MCRLGRRRCAPSRSNWNGSPITPATSVRWPATSVTCRRASYCGRIRGDFLNLTALLCGNRFGRGLVRPGGVLFDVDEARRAQLGGRLAPVPPGCHQRGGAVVEHIVRVVPGSKTPGRLPARRHWNWVWWAWPRGPAASNGMCGRNFPPAFSGSRKSPCRPITPEMSLPGLTCAGWKFSGRSRSSAISSKCCRRGRYGSEPGPLAANRVVVALVEGWRGEICHVALTDAAGRFAALQDCRSVIPQLDGAGPGVARPADLRFPALQQELQPVVLRPRPVEVTLC